MNAGRKLRVAVLMGGIGGERAVSFKSGKAVTEALQEVGHDVIPYDVVDTDLPGLAELRPDVAFLALHGTFGEDGAVQQMLEDMDLPYTGSGPTASRIGMDKMATKRIFIRHAIPTAGYLAVSSEETVEDVTREVAQFGYPVVCKPAAGGSSLGVSIVRGPAELPSALEVAREHDPFVLVERYVHGREFTVGVLDGRALPVIELVVGREFFDYSAKYEDANTRYITPVALLPTVYRRCSEMAVRAYEAIGCRHMARVDMLFGFDGGLYLLEVNTIPGLTSRSLLPMAAAEAGIGFPELCDRITRTALQDAEEAQRRRRSA
jgi:D-alanine-D-alanine ligase